jgi:hypothetical protein
MFAVTYIRIGGQTRLYAAGFFYACMLLYIYGSVTPCWSINVPTANSWCRSTGSAEPFFIFLPNKQLSVMTYTETNCLTANNSTCPATSAHETRIPTDLEQLHALIPNRGYKSAG